MGASRKISSFRWATKFFMLYWHHETGCVSGGGMLLLFDVDTATSSRNAFRVAEEYRTEPHFAKIMLLLMHIFFPGVAGLRHGRLHFRPVLCVAGRAGARQAPGNMGQESILRTRPIDSACEGSQ